MFAYFLVISLLIYEPIQALHIKDFCCVYDKECKGTYDSNSNYHQKCELAKCRGKLGFQCTQEVCSVDKITCENFTNVTNLIGSIKKLIQFQNELRELANFKQNIPKCVAISYNWHLSDVCKNGLNCTQMQEIQMRSGNINLLKKTACQCKGKYSFQCGEIYCTIHKKSCDEILSKRNKVSRSLLKAKNCGNDNLLFVKKVSLF